MIVKFSLICALLSVISVSAEEITLFLMTTNISDAIPYTTNANATVSELKEQLSAIYGRNKSLHLFVRDIELADDQYLGAVSHRTIQIISSSYTGNFQPHDTRIYYQLELYQGISVKTVKRMLAKVMGASDARMIAISRNGRECVDDDEIVTEDWWEHGWPFVRVKD